MKGFFGGLFCGVLIGGGLVLSLFPSESTPSSTAPDPTVGRVGASAPDSPAPLPAYAPGEGEQIPEAGVSPNPPPNTTLLARLERTARDSAEGDRQECAAAILRIEQIAVAESDDVLRAQAAQALGRLASVAPGVMDRILALSEAQTTTAREAAVRAAGVGQTRLIDLTPIVLAALMDPDPSVRSAAIEGLAGAGPEGAQAALLLLTTGNHEPRHIPSLATAVVGAGRFEEALNDRQRPEIVTALVREISARYSDEELPDPIRGLSGKFASLLPLYRPAEAVDYARFFRLAIHAEETKMVTEVALSDDRDESIRRGALTALLSYEPSRATGIDVSETLLLDTPCQPVFRVQIVKELARFKYVDEPCGQRIYGLLERVARDDENEWVREAARSEI
jgi:HEAT repeat